MRNLLSVEGYFPYCGAENCRRYWPRTKFNGRQFFCGCGWESKFDDEFIEQYKEKWQIKESEQTK
jgi:hypothetical protein